MCFYFCYVNVVEEARGKRPCKKPSPGGILNNFVQDSLFSPGISMQGKLISILKKSGDHEPQRRP